MDKAKYNRQLLNRKLENKWMPTDSWIWNPTWPLKVRRPRRPNTISPGVLEEVPCCCWRRAYCLLQSQRACTCDRSGWRRHQRVAPRLNSPKSPCKPKSGSAARTVRTWKQGASRWNKSLIKPQIQLAVQKSPDQSEHPLCHRRKMHTSTENCHDRLCEKMKFRRLWWHPSLRHSGCRQWEEVHALLASRQH